MNEFPWRAALLLTDGSNTYGYFCAGTILSDTWILTAAHCTTAAKEKGYTFVVSVGKRNMLKYFLRRSL